MERLIVVEGRHILLELEQYFIKSIGNMEVERLEISFLSGEGSYCDLDYDIKGEILSSKDSSYYELLNFHSPVKAMRDIFRGIEEMLEQHKDQYPNRLLVLTSSPSSRKREKIYDMYLNRIGLKSSKYYSDISPRGVKVWTTEEDYTDISIALEGSEEKLI